MIRSLNLRRISHTETLSTMSRAGAEAGDLQQLTEGLGQGDLILFQIDVDAGEGVRGFTLEVVVDAGIGSYTGSMSEVEQSADAAMAVVLWQPPQRYRAWGEGDVLSWALTTVVAYVETGELPVEDNLDSDL